jgi:hypothetical protein
MAMKESPPASITELDRSTVAASHRFDIVQILAIYRSSPFNGRGGTQSSWSFASKTKERILATSPAQSA